jgi:catechol 1,2-dioxygenase
MSTPITKSAEVQALLDKVAGLDGSVGDPRLKKIIRRIVGDLFATIEEFNITEDEFWGALNFVAQGAPEFGLWVPGLGFEHFLDLLRDAADKAAGLDGGTPRTIEGPLYVNGAPLVKGEARLDVDPEVGDVLFMQGRVLDADGKPIAGAVVDVWHANTRGNYSHFDPSQSPFNFRRRIETDGEGRYRFRSLVPSGYAVPPKGTTEQLLDAIGRHGKRPAHIHFFVSAPGYRHLTTQINIDGDPYLHDDFAYATRDGLIPPIARFESPADLHARGLNAPYAEIEFDFTLLKSEKPDDEILSSRPRVTLG